MIKLRGSWTLLGGFLEPIGRLYDRQIVRLESLKLVKRDIRARIFEEIRVSAYSY